MSTSLDIATIAARLGADARRFDIDLVAECGSTNAELLARAEAGAASGSVLAAEQQTAGRGRRGREWISGAGDSLTFSLLWRLPPGRAPAGLSLAVGVAVARAIEKLGAGEAAPICLKWPNDILAGGAKLGGILVELVPGSPQAAVIGIGLNLRLPQAMPDELRAVSAALHASVPDADTNAVLAAVLGELRQALDDFGGSGFAALREAWQHRHAFQDAAVCLLSDFAAPREGICRGVDDDGALLFEVDGRRERVLSGEISLRPAP